MNRAEWIRQRTDKILADDKELLDAIEMSLTPDDVGDAILRVAFAHARAPQTEQERALGTMLEEVARHAAEQAWRVTG